MFYLSAVFESENIKVRLKPAVFNIAGYKIPYVHGLFEVTGKALTVFPRNGFLVLNLYSGERYSCSFQNYHRTSTTVNRLYIAGLFTNSSLFIEQTGKCHGTCMALHPVIGHHFLKIPLYTILDRQVEIGICAENTALLRKVQQNEQVNSIENTYIRKFFEKNLPSPSTYSEDPVYHAVNFIIEKNGKVDVGQVARKFCMTKRTLNRHFLIKVGLPVKAYAKIWQLQFAMRFIGKHPQATLEEVAFQSGYYDVAHLARDFSDRVDFAPSTFRSKLSSITRGYIEMNPFRG